MELHNYHTHTSFCDGAKEPEEYVKEALKHNLISLGFSGHAPVPFDNGWSIKPGMLEEYCKAIRTLKKQYAGLIDIFLSLEIDYIPGITRSFAGFSSSCALDYTIGSVHLVKPGHSDDLWFIDGPEKGYTDGLQKIFANNIRLAAETYYAQISEMVFTQKPDIIGHLDKIKMHNKGRYFTEDENWYRKAVNETLRAIASSGSIVEVNTRGIYKKKTTSLFPSVEIIKECYNLNIPLTLSSDTHIPDEIINYFNEAVEIIKSTGYREIYYYSKQGWKSQSI